MTLADRRWEADTPKLMYAANTAPAIVAKPPVMTAWISELVMIGRKGLIISGASVWPRKMLADAFNDSQAVVPTVTCGKKDFLKFWLKSWNEC